MGPGETHSEAWVTAFAFGRGSANSSRRVSPNPHKNEDCQVQALVQCFKQVKVRTGCEEKHMSDGLRYELAGGEQEWSIRLLTWIVYVRYDFPPGLIRLSTWIRAGSIRLLTWIDTTPYLEKLSQVLRIFRDFLRYKNKPCVDNTTTTRGPVVVPYVYVVGRP